jgi:hypothetical protein
MVAGFVDSACTCALVKPVRTLLLALSEPPNIYFYFYCGGWDDWISMGVWVDGLGCSLLLLPS